MENRVLEIIEGFLKIDHEKMLQNLDNKEIWDSLTRVEILFAVEDEFDVVFEQDELSEMNTPTALCRILKSKVD